MAVVFISPTAPRECTAFGCPNSGRVVECIVDMRALPPKAYCAACARKHSIPLPQLRIGAESR